ncbi:MAG TPA: hypothetical protein VMX16_09350 [Terriglobia bacterium]|nr:hypothetical protein [Terriglobia bacterium]
MATGLRPQDAVLLFNFFANPGSYKKSDGLVDFLNLMGKCIGVSGGFGGGGRGGHSGGDLTCDGKKLTAVTTKSTTREKIEEARLALRGFEEPIKDDNLERIINAIKAGRLNVTIADFVNKT